MNESRKRALEFAIETLRSGSSRNPGTVAAADELVEAARVFEKYLADGE